MQSGLSVQYVLQIYLCAKYGCTTPVGILQTKKQTDRQTDRQRLSVSHTSLFKSKVGFNPTLLKKPVLSLPFKLMAARTRMHDCNVHVCY